MFLVQAFGNLLEHVQTTPNRRRVQAYHLKATADSVLEDLGKVIKHRSYVVGGLQTTFETFCVRDSEQRYWNPESLRDHIKTIHLNVFFSNSEIRILWRSFLFYAYHPFQETEVRAKVDWAGFQRAVSHLVGCGTDLLGTQDGDYFWRFDQDVSFFQRAGLRRMLRSIGTITDTINLHSRTSSDILEDAVDVLATTQPYSIILGPEPERLRATARRLRGPTTEYRTSKVEFSTLLSLVLRLNIKKARWGRCNRFGTFEKDDRALGNMLADSVCRGEVLLTEDVDMILDLLPNLQTWFHQLWAVLFQPLQPIERIPVIQGIPIQSLTAVWLTLSQPPDDSNCFLLRGEPTVLEPVEQVLQHAENLTVTRLIKVLAEESRPCVVQFASNSPVPSAAMIGVYFSPRRAWTETAGQQRAASHCVFQVLPKLDILRWTARSVELVDLIHVDDVSLTAETIRSSGEVCESAYQIGPTAKDGVRVDPRGKRVLLMANPVEFNDKYRTSDGQRREVIIEDARMHLYAMSGGQ